MTAVQRRDFCALQREAVKNLLYAAALSSP
jgi:hypothetical protein